MPLSKLYCANYIRLQKDDRLMRTNIVSIDDAYNFSN